MWPLVLGPLLLAFGTAVLMPRLWRAWTRPEPEALPPASPRRPTLPPSMGGVTMAEASRALARPAVAPDVVLRSRGRGLEMRLRDQGRYDEACMVDRAIPSRADLLALLREHGVSTSPEPQS